MDGFGLVLGAPPSTSSDLGLEEALELLENVKENVNFPHKHVKKLFSFSVGVVT